MNEIYWITVLGGINNLSTAIWIISLTIIAFAGLLTLVSSGDIWEDCESFNSAKKWVKRLFVIAIVSALIDVFVPSKKEALAIWGVGGTIDYLKSNDTAKQMPDKCIKALDKFVDSYIDKDKK